MNEETCNEECIGHYLLRPYAQGKKYEPSGRYAYHAEALTEMFGPYTLGDVLPDYIATLYF